MPTINNGGEPTITDIPPRIKPSLKAEQDATAGDSQPPKTPPRKLSTADRKLARSISDMYSSIGVVTYGLAGQNEALRTTAERFVSQSDTIADEWMKLADSNPRVKRALHSLTEGSALAGVIGVHVACLLPLIANRLPAGIAEAVNAAGHAA
jgi:hypothetical protein